jgi:putative transposase
MRPNLQSLRLLGMRNASHVYMSRLPRFFAPGYPLHIVQRGNNRATTFHCDRDRLFYLELLAKAAAEYGLKVHAYALMSNHVHVLATPLRPDSAARTMQAVGRGYVRWFNLKYERSGTLWEGRYRATIVDTEHYLVICHKYVEFNSVRAHLVGTPDQYRWSSFRANALGTLDPLLTPHPFYIGLGLDGASRQRAYRRLMAEPLDDNQLCTIRAATNGGWALGNEAFLIHIEGATGRRAAPLLRKPGLTVEGARPSGVMNGEEDAAPPTQTYGSDTPPTFTSTRCRP